MSIVVVIQDLSCYHGSPNTKIFFFRFLIKNPTYMCITAVVGIELAVAAGFSTFLPKFVANQFAQSASWAAMITGKLTTLGE